MTDATHTRATHTRAIEHTSATAAHRTVDCLDMQQLLAQRKRVFRLLLEVTRHNPHTQIYTFESESGNQFCYNVSAAWQMMMNQAVDNRAAHLQAQMMVDLHGFLPVLHGMDVDPDLVATKERELHVPLLLAPSIENPEQTLCIDGWHRIHRAVQLGVWKLPALMLTAEQEKAVRIYAMGPDYPITDEPLTD
jgi:hypothetical protein